MKMSDILGENPIQAKVNQIQPEMITPISPFNDLQLKMPTDPNLASEFHKRLVKMINDFNESLDPEHEVGLQLCNFGQSIVIYIEDIGYYNPSLICFFGFDKDKKNSVELIQHVSQINILLVKLPRMNPEKPKQPIGFSSES